MRLRPVLTLASVAALALLAAHGSARAQSVNIKRDAAPREDYLPEPTPPGFRVTVNAQEGPVFADANGKTVYRWPLKSLRNGDVGDRRDAASSCTSEITQVNSGMMSPYPPGLLLPDLATRKSCETYWPPVLAAAGAGPVGKWTIILRKDGKPQWAYDGFPLYTSVLDERPGDVLGGSNKNVRGPDGPGRREPIPAQLSMPPAFGVQIVGTGRLLTDFNGFSIYAWDGDAPGKSNCTGGCLDKWKPVLAAETSQPVGEWTIIQRSPGVRQWAFRKEPLYRFVPDVRPKSLLGSDEPGWHNVYTQHAAAWPKEFTIQESHAGLVLGDAKGKTLYVYYCVDDAFDQQICDHPTTPQDYRLSVCGNNDPALCLKTWPLVMAPKDAKSPSPSWTAVDIDPMTGRYAKPGDPGSVHVWAFRGRPVYTFADDEPGDVNGDGWGEFYGFRNGFKAFWLRDDFFVNSG